MSQYLISTALLKYLHTVVVITMFPYSEQVQDIELTVQVLEMIWVLNELIQANEMVFINFWYIEHYGACFGDDIDAKMNYFKHVKWLFNVY